ncbi:MAG: efflux RND transporter periplasmic adaptor subunit [Schwartzia sp.]|nr:efflux RND transporter periplasmic adaptor subunit [Schwartzia sp. (in: firmicutes)]
MEVDISRTVNRFLKYGLVGLIAGAVLCSGIVWWYQSSHKVLTLVDAAVVGNAVGVRSRANGTITTILVKDGESVKTGQSLANIEVKVSEEQIKQLAQSVELAKQNLAQVRQGTTVSRPVVIESGGSAQQAAQLERMEQLYAIGAVSARQLEEARAEYEAGASAGSVSYQTVHQPASEQAIRQAELTLRQAEAALLKAQEASQATEITAPVPGTVYLSEMKSGDEVRAGQVILSIGNSESFWIEAYVDPAKEELFKLGQYVSYTVGGKTFDGTIADIEQPKGKTESNAGTEGVNPNDIHADKLTIRIALPEKWDAVFRPQARAVVKVNL